MSQRELPPFSHGLNRWFMAYVRRYLRKHFHAVRLLAGEFEDEDGRPGWPDVGDEPPLVNSLRISQKAPRGMTSWIASMFGRRSMLGGETLQRAEWWMSPRFAVASVFRMNVEWPATATRHLSSIYEVAP